MSAMKVIPLKARLVFLLVDDVAFVSFAEKYVEFKINRNRGLFFPQDKQAYAMLFA